MERIVVDLRERSPAVREIRRRKGYTELVFFRPDATQPELNVRLSHSEAASLARSILFANNKTHTTTREY